MPVTLGNNAVSRLASSLTAGATTLSVTAGEGAKFPSPSAGQWFPLTLIKSSGSLEILRCTGRSGDVFTVARGQEGTAAQSFSAGDRAELRLTAAAILEIQQSITDSTAPLLRKDDNLAALTDKSAARTNLQLGEAAQMGPTAVSYDRTPQRLLRVGDGGINTGPAYGADGPTTGIDAYKYCGFWSAASATGTPVGNYPTIIAAGNETNSVQIASPVLEADRLYFRKLINGAWQAARELFHTGNIPSYIQTLMQSANAGIARNTLGVPAGIDKQMCTAWVNFSGVGVVGIRESFNVSSVGDLGVGDYVINFATSMTNTGFATAGMASSYVVGGTANCSVQETSLGDRTLNTLRVRTAVQDQLVDLPQINVSVFGGK